eukprot:m.53740 g.53740  ORF g.53740 m.53740 type:complete len:396 (+) comp10881_c0_seq1:301-1488(+)
MRGGSGDLLGCTMRQLRSSIVPTALRSLRNIHNSSLSLNAWKLLDEERNQSKALVLRSQSIDPFWNLAFEDWISNKKDLKANILFLWQNGPTVVLGRNQNPWIECNLRLLEEKDITLARRSSGGGTVFHDLGNLNCTFFTARDKHDPKKNASFLQSCLESIGLPVTISKRNDLFLYGRKISGSAYRLTSHVAYHHCTLLVDTELKTLGSSLRSPLKSSIVAKGVESISSPVTNLITHSPSSTITVDSVSELIGKQFLTWQCGEKNNESSQLSLNFRDQHVPAYVTDRKQQLGEWQWRFGLTPQFNLEHSFAFEWGMANLSLNVKHGIIQSGALLTSSKYLDLDTFPATIQGQKFHKDVILDALEGASWSSVEGRSVLEDVRNQLEDHLIFSCVLH